MSYFRGPELSLTAQHLHLKRLHPAGVGRITKDRLEWWQRIRPHALAHEYLCRLEYCRYWYPKMCVIDPPLTQLAAGRKLPHVRSTEDPVFTARRDQGPFFCQSCRDAMSLVLPQIRARPHFRHHVESNCAWEPETPDHEAAKLAVCDAINQLGLGTADVESPVGKWVADVLWTHHGQRIAFEIQRANYTWEKFDEKFTGYAAEGVAVVYLLIGPHFFASADRGRFRLKDVERRLFLGLPEKRTYRPPVQRIGTAHFLRVYREPLGRVVGAYLRKRANAPQEILVREPLFYPVSRRGGGWNDTLADEAAAAVHPLADFLRLLHATFLRHPDMSYWNGQWFRRREEAVWAYFFDALGLKYTFEDRGAGQAGVFHFGGPNSATGWVRGATAPPSTSEESHEVVLNLKPELRQNYLFVGSVDFGSVGDEAILGCYTRDVKEPVVDFSQHNQVYSGVISGLHDGGVPGGNRASKIALQAYNLWLDGDARLSRGHPVPLGEPKFYEGDNVPRRFPSIVT
jgi:hypothetical protein